MTQLPILRPCTAMGLDLSLRATGIIILEPSGDVQRVDTVGQELPRSASQKARVGRLAHICDMVELFFEVGHPDLVAIEGASFASRYGQACLAELHGAVKLALWRRWGIAPIAVPVARARCDVLGSSLQGKGKGKGKRGLKKAVRAAVRQVYGIDFKDDNQADAFVIARYCQTIYGRDRDGLEICGKSGK